MMRVHFAMQARPKHMAEEILDAVSAAALGRVNGPTYIYDRDIRIPKNTALGGIVKHVNNGVPRYGAVLAMETVHAARNAAIDMRYSRGVSVKGTIPNNLEMGYHDDFVHMIGLRVVHRAMRLDSAQSAVSTEEALA
jgi:hypothetical protein